MPAAELPPSRWYRLRDGRTLAWAGPAWTGFWVFGEATFPALPVGPDSRGEPVGPDGYRLEGGFVAAYPNGRDGSPSPRTPTPVQKFVLDRLPMSGDDAEALDGNRKRSLLSVSDAGWVYPTGFGGWATLKLTEAGEKALDRAVAARQRARARWARSPNKM